jgi:replication factor A1
MAGALIAGTIRQIWTSDEQLLYRVLQVVKLVRHPSNSIIVDLSDGELYQQALLDLTSRDSVVDALLTEFCLVLITGYTVHIIGQGVKVVTITSLSYLDNPGHQIGSPSQFEARQLHPRLLRDEHGEFLPIQALTLMRRDWVIKARVMLKSSVKVRSQRTGKTFSCVLMDACRTEIQATFFNAAVDLHFERVEEGKVYTFSNGQVCLALAKFNPTSNELQLNFNDRAVVEEVVDDGTIGALTYDIVPIELLRSLTNHTTVDICAVVLEVSETAYFVNRTGDRQSKRVLKLVDPSKTSVELTLFGEFTEAEALNRDQMPKLILLGKGLQVSDFNSISLATRLTSKLLYNESGHEVISSMERWRDTELPRVTEIYDLSITRLSSTRRELKTLREIKAMWEDRAMTEELCYVNGIVGQINHDNSSALWYTACIDDKCKRKVSLESHGYYCCEVCQKSFAECQRRYRFSVRLHDSTGLVWAQAFDEVGLKLLGRSANDLFYLTQSEQGMREFEAICLKSICSEYEFTLRVKMNESRQEVDYTIAYASPLDSNRAAEMYLREIAEALEFT